VNIKRAQKRKTKGLPIHGWLNLEKPAGMSSSKVVSLVRRFTGAAKAGHGGTLDPLATGVLPVALGEATKTVSFVMDGFKTYVFVVRWGIGTATDDREGEVIKITDGRPTIRNIKRVLSQFTGEISQVPPIFSAIKVNGKRAYDLARSSKDVVLQPRSVKVTALSITDTPDRDHTAFKVKCGKGTYIRALARDMSLALGTCGHISSLRRISVGAFREKESISLDKLESLGHIAPGSKVLWPIETVLDDIPALALTVQEAKRLRQGQGVPALPVASRTSAEDIAPGDLVCAISEGKLVALAKINGGEIRPVRVLNH